MSDSNIVNLCDAFIDAIENDALKIIEASLTVEEYQPELCRETQSMEN